LGWLFLTEQQHPKIQLRLVQALLILEYFLVIGNCLGVFAHQALRKCQLEARVPVLGIFGQRFFEMLDGKRIVLRLQRLDAFGRVIDGLQQKRQCEQFPGHACLPL
jgi:hypothetical protein